ncbi:CrcB family protein [uncultured Limosilactobacillus sp.]|uniref:fluoride efflux transporter FluC n=1 Tax=uncultured Limosilactobacillus sp. TaxID=2837629 RepID=UPI0025FA7062|nr:CrcB family protein [uncultured Limosilactobacillus sp.]
MKIKNCISVLVFAFLGGCTRWSLSTGWSTYGILSANLFGSFLLAFLTYYIIEQGIFSEWLSTGLGTGFIGAFTTFSTFATTTVKLAQHQVWTAGMYFLISAFGGLIMALLGFALARNLGRDEE